MNEKNVKGRGDFNFLNERVMESRKNKITKLGGFLIFCVILCIFVLILLLIKSDLSIKSILSNGETKDSGSQSSSDISGDGKVEQETVDRHIEDIGQVGEGVVPLYISAESKENYSELYNQESEKGLYASGLVIQMGSEVKLITSYDFVKEVDKVTALINHKRCTGRVDSISREYGLAVVSIAVETEDSKNLNETEDFKENVSDILYKEDLKNIRCAEIDKEIKYGSGDGIVIAGVLADGEKYIVNGSLTSVENMYNIVDAQPERVNTNILETKSNIDNGFIFDSNGKVIGIINPLYDAGGIDVVSAVSFKGLERYIDKLIEKKCIPYLGIYGKMVTDEVIESIDKDMPYGIYIYDTEHNSPAYVSGIMNGDIIVKFNGGSIYSFKDYARYLGKCEVSDEVIVVVMRKGKGGYKEINYTVKIGGR